jgi:L-lactate dehydrogenase complex protein LldE
MLHVGDGPYRLLRQVRELELVDLPNQEQCCGFGGTFAIKNADVSVAMLSEKNKEVLETGAEVITALDNSCLMQIYGGLHRQGSSVRAMHLAEILSSSEVDR